MGRFWQVLYNAFGVPLLYSAFMLASPFLAKIKKGLAGRKNLFENLESAEKRLPRGPRFWIHNSSMGEFEQARPLIESLKRTYPDGSVIVSFFSPSGYDHVHEIREADLVCYLPFDSLQNAKRFLDILKPDAALVIRHDMWPNHIWELERRRIPLFLANCSIPSPRRFFASGDQTGMPIGLQRLH
jgi:3-deoxy-D-manno-octulosonic-acid transferase